MRRHVEELLYELGEHVDLEVLENTPRRVAKAWREMTEGYRQDPAKILGKTFESSCDEMVVVQDIDFTSLCAHHLLPFTGKATVAYIPNGRIVGLSKIPRLVQCFSRRLQLQEHLTQQIANAIDLALNPLGVGVVLKGQHSCMALRGVRSQGRMITSVLLGLHKEDPAARSEFMSLARQV